MSDYIYHHGVKGMKWGVRKDKKSSGTATNTTKTDKPKLSEEQKKAIKKKALKFTGRLAVSLAITAVGATALSSPKIRTLIGKGFEAMSKNRDRDDGSDPNEGKMFDTKTGKYADVLDFYDYVQNEDGSLSFKRKPGH